MATGVLGIVAEIYIRTGKMLSNSAISYAAALLNKKKEIGTIIEFQKQLKCCGFLLNDKLKYYVNCSSEDEQVGKN